MSKFAFVKLLTLSAVLALATPAAAQSTDDDQTPQTLPAPAIQGMPGLGMTGPIGPMGGGSVQSPGMGGMMQMMQMMQSSQMMQMAQMMQMMQMMQQMQGGVPGRAMGMPGAGMGMQGGPGGMMGGTAIASGDVEPLIAGWKTALAITDAQQPQWNAFADALRAGAKQIHQARTATSPDSSAPAQLQRRAALLEAEAAAMKQSQTSAAALYNALSAKQKQIADRLMADHLARM